MSATTPRASGFAWPAVGSATGRTDGWDAPVQTLRTVSRHLVELHVSARPSDLSERFTAQAGSMYRNLLEELSAQGAGPCDIASEKVFLSDIGTQTHDLLRVRDESRAGVRGDGGPAPALSLVEQPPARERQLCEVQACALVSPGSIPVVSRNLEKLPPGCSGRSVEAGGVRHLFLAGVTGGSSGDRSVFTDQAAEMFLNAEQVLRREGLSFRDVIRTWIYLKDIDSDYSDLNLCRREFFAAHDVRPAPASTGIRGAVHPPDRVCGLDLRAIAHDGSVEVRTIHAPTMNEAPAYGSDFSRGTRLTFQDRAVLYISGTASIDTAGRVVSPGEIEGQVDRMLVNVSALLAGQGATWRDLVSAITYLKDPRDMEAFRRVCRRHGLSERVPNTICVADVCRPEWLCEMEAIAVLA